MAMTKAQVFRNSAVRESLVDMSDRDYLAARACWRTRLPEQFLWCALQAVEKQLKAILVLNGRPAKGLNHRVGDALTRVLEIKDLRIDVPEPVRKFIRYLEKHGPNRYLERSFYLRGSELFDLDRSFWHLRRYCQDFRATAGHVGKSEKEWLDSHESWFTDQKLKARPYHFRLTSGYLESVLEGKHGPEQYRVLVWKNFYFGKRGKGRIEYSPVTWMANPVHVRYPEAFEELAKILDYPRDVREAFGTKSQRAEA